MSKLHVNHVRVSVEKLFRDQIDISDFKSKSPNEQERAFLTRGLAAYSLHVLASVDVDTAVKSIVDGYNDNGLDAILFDRNEKILWLVQSKWFESGQGEPENGDIKKFIGGVRDLIDFKMDRFNAKVKSKESDILEALDDPIVKIRIVIAYTGQSFLEVSRRDLEDLMQELNDPSDLASYYIFSLREAHRALTGSIDGKPINVEIALSHWGQIEEPYKAYFGIINAADVAHWWIENRRRLFADNIRNFIGLTEINEAIIETLDKQPEHFWYFNNGITVLCKKIGKKPLGGGDRSTGYFVCEGISVVNGAQTVGSIGHAFEKPGEKVSNAKLFIRLISLEDCPEDFGQRITKATNTQNRIEKRDFVTLDPGQERLRTELLLEGKNYHYIRTDEKINPDDKNCTLEEATVALACANPDVSLAVQAKREAGKLWEDILQKPYIDIFNPEVTATKLWRAVQILRDVNTFLKSKEIDSIGRERSFYIHANRFVLHLVFQKVNKHTLLDPNFNFENFRRGELLDTIGDIVEFSKIKVEEIYPTSLIHQLFRNFTKCRDLKSQILS